jgi:hypothetical protein
MANERTKLRKQLREKISEEGNFEATMKDIVLWYERFNIIFFKNELPNLTDVEIRHFKGMWAEANCQFYDNNEVILNGLKIRKNFPSMKEFLQTIGHEMVHVWEYKYFSTMGHGKRFSSWKPKFKRVGLDIS